MNNQPNIGNILATALNKPMTTDSQYEMIRGKVLRDHYLPVATLVDDLIRNNNAKIAVIKYLKAEYGMTLTDAKFYYEERQFRLREVSRLRDELDRADLRAY